MRSLPRQAHWQRGARPNRPKASVAAGGWLKRFWTVVQQVVGCFLMLACLILGIVGGTRLWQRAVAHPRLQVHHIAVTGVVRAREGDILAYAQTALNTPMVTLDMDAIALGVRRHPWVQAVQVRRQFPDRLAIEVAEHRPTLLVALGGLYVADEDGQLFKSFDTADHLDLPIVSGLQRNAEGATDALHERVREAIGLAGAIENHPASLGTLDELHWDHDVGWSAVLRQSHDIPTSKPGAQVSVRVYMGRDPLARLPVVVETMQVLAQRHQTPKVIWADFMKNPRRVQVQLVSTRDNPPRTHASEWRRA
jgi:hypothetical protein